MAAIKTDGKANVQIQDLNQKPFDNIINFRDVGKTINEFLGEKTVAEGRIYRCARPDDATLSDRQRLKEEYGIKAIMDLRTVTEHQKQATRREKDLQDSAILKANPALSEPVRIPGINYLEVNINGKGFERSLIWKLKYWSLFKLIFLISLGYRTEAISILGREVMQPRGLTGLGIDTLTHCGPELAQATMSFASPENLPILVHCTQGKDRTGIVVILVLLVVFSVTYGEGNGKDKVKALAKEYLLSAPALKPERENRLKEIREIGLTDDFADCPEDFVKKIVGWMKERHGGVEGYLDSTGVGEEERARVGRVLCWKGEGVEA